MEKAPPSKLPLTLEIAVTAEAIAALGTDYEGLHRATGNSLPFALHGWHETWCMHFLRRDARIHDQAFIYVVRDALGGCVAILPLIWTTRRIGPLRASSVGLLGADPALTEIRNPLVLPGYERAVVRAVHLSLSRLRNWDWIHWNGVDAAFAAALQAEVKPEWYAPTEDLVLDLPASWKQLCAGLKRNIRESLRHCYNSLKRDGHAFEFVVARTPGEIGPALDRFLELHVLRAQFKTTARHPNRFQSKVARDFLYAVCARLAADDVVRVFQLRIAGRIVAARLAFVVGDSMYLYYSGYEPAWGKYGVMTTTMAEALKYGIDHGLKSANLSPTSDIAKTRWGPRVVEYSNAFVRRDRLLSGILCRAYFEGRFGEGAYARLVKYVASVRRDWS